MLLAGDEVSCDSRGHESCNYNGNLEYKYAAKQLQQNLYDSLYNDFLECGVASAHARGSTNDILYPKGTPSSRALSQLILKVYRDIIQKFTPGPIEFILQWAFLSGSVARSVDVIGTFRH